MLFRVAVQHGSNPLWGGRCVAETVKLESFVLRAGEITNARDRRACSKLESFVLKSGSGDQRARHGVRA